VFTALDFHLPNFPALESGASAEMLPP
jgi:hypothetical protein